MRRHSAIVLVCFGWGSLVVGDLRRVNLVGLGEELCWLRKILDIDFGNLIHLLEFVDVSLEFRYVGQDCGQIFV